MKTIFVAILAVLSICVSAQSTCPVNMGFELGDFTNWQCYVGTVTTDGPCTNTTVTATPSAPIPGRHLVLPQNSLVDPFGYFPITPDNQPVARLGFVGQSNAQVERISYTFSIPSSVTNYSLTYKYALVLQDGNHCPKGQAHFEAKVFDVTTNQYINCVSYEYYPPLGFNGYELSTNTSQNLVYFKRWTPVTLLLSDYAGHTLRLEFTNADCGYVGHWGYAYVDVVDACGSSSFNTQFCGSDSTVTAPYGFKSYRWWNNSFTQALDTTQTLKLASPPTVPTVYAVDLIPNPGFGCRDTAFITVNPGAINVPANAGPDVLICGSTPGLTIGTPAVPGYSYFWTPNSAITGINLAQPTINPGANITYYLTVSSTTGNCSKKDTVNVTVAPAVSASFSVNTQNQCLAGNNYQFTATATNPSGTQYSWSFGDGSNSTQQSPSYSYANAGTYVVKLVTSTSTGCKDSTTKTVVVSSPVATFAVNSNTQCLTGNIFQFTPNNTSTGLTYSWNFGDGGNSTQQNPSHSFAGTGTYTVKLVTNLNGCSDSTTQTVSVVTSPVSTFSVSNATQCISNNLFQFNATNTSAITYQWDFGDGGNSTQQNPSHSYVNAGVFTVKVVVTNLGGCKDSTTQNVSVVTLPVATFSINNSSQCLTGNLFQFASNNTTSGVTYSWNFGDGGNSAQQNATHTYTNAGTYTVKLVATVSNGCQDSTTQSVTVIASPVSNFSINNTTQCLTNNLFQFTSSNTTASSYQWSFGDGANSAQQNPSHSFVNAGAYTVKLVTTNSNGCKDSTTQTVSVSAAPVATFSINSATQCVSGNLFQFNSNNTNASGYQWSFGDGGNSTQQNPSHSFANTGSFTIKLVTTNSSGCKDSTTQTVTVNALPTANYTVNNATQCITNNSFQFTMTGNITGNSYQWNFGDGGTSNQANPSHAYATTGSFPVKVIVTNANNCKDSTIKNMTVTAVPVVSISLSGNVLTSSAATGNQWYLNGVAIAGATGQTHTATASGSYTVIAALNGCTSAESNALIYNVTGLDLITAEWKLQIAPNPTEGKLMITYSGAHKLDLEVFDMTGRQLITSKHIPNSYTVNLSMYVSGTYLVHLTNSKTKQEVKKLVVKL